MIVYKNVSIHEDEEDGIAYFFTEARRETLCKDCPCEGGKVYEPNEETAVYMECPCPTIKMVASGQVALEAYKAIKESGMLEDLVDSVRNNEFPIGAGHEGLIKVVDK